MLPGKIPFIKALSPELVAYVEEAGAAMSETTETCTP